MFSFLRNRELRKVERSQQETTQLQPINYPPKIIIAWAKAIDGDQKVMRWLKDNGYFELCMASYAIYLKDQAREWLSKNKYAHLLAFITACEGNKAAQKWLITHQFEQLYHMAMAIENETTSKQWLQKNTTSDILFLTQTIKKVKDKIEENHNDIHSFRKDI